MKTKHSLLVFTFFASSLLTLSAELVLHKGETYSYEFSALPFSQMRDFCSAKPCYPVLDSWGEVSIHAPSQTGDLLVELYENSLSAAPVSSTTLMPSPNLQQAISPYIWQDHQGAVRFTMLSGSVDIDWFDVRDAVYAGPSVRAIYATRVEPVPEPHVFEFLLLIGIACGFGRARKRVFAKSEARAG